MVATAAPGRPEEAGKHDMGFFDNAENGRDIGLVRSVRDGIQRVRDGERDNLVEVIVRVRRMNLTKYAEAPFVIPRDLLSDVYALAENFRRSLDVIAIDHVPGNDLYNVRAFLKMDETVVIEVVSRDYEPPLNDEDVRRRRFIPAD